MGGRGARSSFLPGSGTRIRRKQVNNLAIRPLIERSTRLSFLIPERLAQSRDAVGQFVNLGSEAPTEESFTLQAKRRARRETKCLLAYEALAECQAVGHPFHAREDVHRAIGDSNLDFRQLAQAGDQEIPRAPETLERVFDYGLP